MITLTAAALDTLTTTPGTGPRSEPPALPFAWWCASCQRRTPFGYDQLRQFAHHGWPVCCGEVVLALPQEAFAHVVTDGARAASS